MSYGEWLSLLQMQVIAMMVGIMFMGNVPFEISFKLRLLVNFITAVPLGCFGVAASSTNGGDDLFNEMLKFLGSFGFAFAMFVLTISLN